jgi:hypothetical protein
MPAMRNTVKPKAARHNRKINLSGLDKIKIIAADKHITIKDVQGETGVQLPAMAPVTKDRKTKNIGASVNLCLMFIYALPG